MSRTVGPRGRDAGAGWQRFAPEPLAFTIVLTMVALAAAVVWTPATPADAVRAWGDGLGSLMPFVGQMACMLLFAYALVHVGGVPGFLAAVAARPRTERQARAFVCVATGLASLAAWPLGLIVGGILVRAVVDRFAAERRPVDPAALGASAFGGYVIWHMGYSATAPLFVATPGHAMSALTGGVIPVAETILAPWNVATAAVTLAAVTATVVWLLPRPWAVAAAAAGARSDEVVAARSRPVAGRASWGARSASLVLGLLVWIYLADRVRRDGLQLDLDIVNWSFLAAGLVLTRSPREYLDAVMAGGRAVAPVLLLYPLYAGIMGLMMGTGVLTALAELLVRAASRDSLPVVAFLSGGLLNFFVPSGGAQWAVQGPVFLEAARSLGTEVPLVVMGVAYGDQWTNIVHPFVVVPFAAIAKLEERRILAFTVLPFLVAGVTLAAGLWLAGPG